MLTSSKTADGWLIDTPHYRARIIASDAPAVHVYREGCRLMRMPAVSGLAAVEAPEQLRAVTVDSVRDAAGDVTVALRGDSSLWPGRRFIWRFGRRCITYRHEAAGPLRPGRCYFFSNGPAAAGADVPDGGAGAVVDATHTYCPAANLADEYRRVVSIPQSLGIYPEAATPFAYGVPDRTAMIFAPPMLCLAFGTGDRWMGVGIGTAPGGYQFNSLEYAPERVGAMFFVNYLGYSAFADTFASPVAALHFGYSPHEVFQQYADWTDAEGFATARAAAAPSWHRRPVFCGWGEQTWQAADRGCRPQDEATQANYEQWVGVLEARRLPAGTLVIDDKWQAAYGTFEVDAAKWPDMLAFVHRRHEEGRHVLLWVPVYHAEGLPDDLCIHREGRAVAADVSNPAYEALLRGRIAHLVRDVGIDGFKVDWVWGTTREPGMATHAPLHGIEWLRRFQTILYGEAHRWRPDALVETHSACPLFRDCSDVLRLNDLHQGARNVAAAMAERARLARIAGWPLADCDNAGSTLDEWWACMQAQPRFGVPSLYQLTGTRLTGEVIPEWMWQALRNIWADYLAAERAGQHA